MLAFANVSTWCCDRALIFCAQEVAPFRYHHLGSFAFVGADNAVLEMPMTQDKPGAFTGFLTGPFRQQSCGPTVRITIVTVTVGLKA